MLPSSEEARWKDTLRSLLPCPLGFGLLVMDPAQFEAERQCSLLVGALRTGSHPERNREEQERVDSGEIEGRYHLDIHHFIYSLQ